MTEKELCENNKLIADFMDYPESGKKNKDPYYYAMKHCYDNNAMKYHSSWDWIMPVVLKISEPEIEDDRVIREPCDFAIRYKNCELECSDEDDSFEFSLPTGADTKMEAVYLCVIEYIKWYNSINES